MTLKDTSFYVKINKIQNIIRRCLIWKKKNNTKRMMGKTDAEGVIDL